MIKDFKFFQNNKVRVFTEWMDQMDDYHLGGIEPTRNTDVFDEMVVGMIEHCRTNAIHMVGFTHSFEMTGVSHSIEIRSVERIAGGAQVHYHLTLDGSTINISTIINNNNFRW